MRLNNKLKQLIMKKSILITILSLFSLSGVFGQVTINTMSIAPSSTFCAGVGTVNVIYSLTNSNVTPITLAGNYKIEFVNMITPTIIGTTPMMTITIPAMTTTTLSTIVGTVSAVPNGLTNFRVKFYNGGITPSGLNNPLVPNQLYVLNAPSPTVTAIGSTSLCPSGTVQLSTSSIGTYSWSSGPTTQSITINTPNTYTVKVTNMCGFGTSSPFVVTAMPNPSISISAAGSTTICAGQSLTLNSTASSYTSIVWSNAMVGPAISVTSSAVYYAIATNTCGTTVNSNSITVTVNSLPIVTAVTSASAVCSGQTVTLTASGANTYTLVTVGAFSGTTTVNPSTSTTYTVIGKNTLTGCVNTTSVIQNVNPLPVLSVVTSNSLLCMGQTAILSVSGANTYSWDAGPTTNTLAVSPTVNTVYNVTGIDLNGCVNSYGALQNVTTCTGIENSNIKSVISKVYPVPANDNINVELGNVNDNSKISVNIYSIEGKNVLSYKTELNGNKTNVSVVDLQSGMYILEIVSDSFKSTSRIVVSK